MDKVFINDPLFELTRIEGEQSQVVGQYLGMEDTGIDREKLSEAIDYMKTATPMVAGQFAKFIPMSYIHEPPNKTPIYHSQNYFADVLPKDLINNVLIKENKEPTIKITNIKSIFFDGKLKIKNKKLRKQVAEKLQKVSECLKKKNLYLKIFSIKLKYQKDRI